MEKSRDGPHPTDNRADAGEKNEEVGARFYLSHHDGREVEAEPKARLHDSARMRSMHEVCHRDLLRIYDIARQVFIGSRHDLDVVLELRACDGCRLHEAI